MIAFNLLLLASLTPGDSATGGRALEFHSTLESLRDGLTNLSASLQNGHSLEKQLQYTALVLKQIGDLLDFTFESQFLVENPTAQSPTTLHGNEAKLLSSVKGSLRNINEICSPRNCLQTSLEPQNLSELQQNVSSALLSHLQNYYSDKSYRSMKTSLLAVKNACDADSLGLGLTAELSIVNICERCIPLEMHYACLFYDLETKLIAARTCASFGKADTIKLVTDKLDQLNELVSGCAVEAKIRTLIHQSAVNPDDIGNMLAEQFKDTEFYVHQFNGHHSCLQRFKGSEISNETNSRQFGALSLDTSTAATSDDDKSQLTVVWRKLADSQNSTNCVGVAGAWLLKVCKWPEFKIVDIGNNYKDVNSFCKNATREIQECAKSICGVSPSFVHIACARREHVSLGKTYSNTNQVQREPKILRDGTIKCISTLGFWEYSTAASETLEWTLRDFSAFEKLKTADKAFNDWISNQGSCSASDSCLDITPIFGEFDHPSSLWGIYSPLFAKNIEALSSKSALTNILADHGLFFGLAENPQLANIVRKAMPENVRDAATSALVVVAKIRNGVNACVEFVLKYLRQRYTIAEVNLDSERLKWQETTEHLAKTCIEVNGSTPRSIQQELLTLLEPMPQRFTVDWMKVDDATSVHSQLAALWVYIQFIAINLREANEICDAVLGRNASDTLASRNALLAMLHGISKILRGTAQALTNWK